MNKEEEEFRNCVSRIYGMDLKDVFHDLKYHVIESKRFIESYIQEKWYIPREDKEEVLELILSIMKESSTLRDLGERILIQQAQEEQ